MRRTRRLCCCIVDVQVRGGFHGGGEGGGAKGGREGFEGTVIVSPRGCRPLLSPTLCSTHYIGPRGHGTPHRQAGRQRLAGARGGARNQGWTEGMNGCGRIHGGGARCLGRTCGVGWRGSRFYIACGSRQMRLPPPCCSDYCPCPPSTCSPPPPQVTFTTRLGVEATSSLLPVTYDRFHDMASVGDTIYVSGRAGGRGGGRKRMARKRERKPLSASLVAAGTELLAARHGIEKDMGVERSSSLFSNSFPAPPPPPPLAGGALPGVRRRLRLAVPGGAGSEW